MYMSRSMWWFKLILLGLHSAPSQTDPLPTYTDAESQAQLTASAPTTTTTSTLDPPAFNWSEDVTAIPIIPMFTKNQLCLDLSALQTSNPNPFSSLSHRNCCSWLPFENHHISVPQPPFQPCRAPPHLSVSQTTTIRNQKNLFYIPSDRGKSWAGSCP